MNKISLAFALVFFIALSFTGCKSTKKVGTVEAGGAKRITSSLRLCGAGVQV